MALLKHISKNDPYQSFELFICTVKPLNKGHPRERWSLLTSGLYLEVTLFYLIKEGLLKCGLY